MSQPAPMPWSSQTPTVGPPDTVEAADTHSGRRRKAVEQRRRSFLRMVSHELRTPLNTVIGFSEIIASELYGPLGTPEYKEYAELVRQSGYRLLKLVN